MTEPNLAPEVIKTLQRRIEDFNHKRSDEALTVFCGVLGLAIKDILENPSQHEKNIENKGGNFIKKEKKYTRLDLDLREVDCNVLQVALGAVKFFVPSYKIKPLEQSIARSRYEVENFNYYRDGKNGIMILNHDYGHPVCNDLNAEAGHLNVETGKSKIKMHLVFV